MRKVVALLLVCGVAGIAVADKPQLKPYGFIKGDMYYASDPVVSYGKPSLTCVSRATDEATGGEGIAFTAQHSRFGLKGSADVGEVNIGGRLELDFWVIAANANAKPRMRLAYAWCKPLEGLDIRIGQQWDIFSPLNPTTNNTNANLWYNGNYGFRRPMFQLRYGLDLGAVTPGLQVSVGEATKEKGAGDWIGLDNEAAFPMIQARIATGITDKFTLGVAGVHAAYGEDKDYTTSGVSVDASLPLHKLFALKGEFAYGENLNNGNIFTLGGSGDADTYVKNMGFWVNAISKPLDFLHVALGVAQETILDPAPDAIEKNVTFYGDLIVPVGKYFSFAAEYQYLKTTLENETDYSANVIDIAGKVSF